MSFSFRNYLNSLTTPRSIKVLGGLDAELKRLSPSDAAIGVVLTFLIASSAFAMLAHTSLSLAIEIPARGGTYTEGIVGAPRFVNPVLALSEADRDLTTLVFSGLMKQNSDGILSPDLAASYTVSDDGLTYTFTLRDTAIFHDKTPVTAEDVAFTVGAIQNPAMKSPRRANWEGVLVSVVGEKISSFTLKAPYGPFLENLTLGILPSRLWREGTAEEFPFSSLNTNPVGSGPYRLGTIRQNSSGIPVEYDLVAFRDGARSPYIDRIVFKFYGKSEDLQNALDTEAIQAANSVNPAGVAESTSHRVEEAVFARVFGVFFNQNQNDIFADQAVRKALDTAIDKQAIVSTVVSGYGSVIHGLLPPNDTRIFSEESIPKEARIASSRALLEKAEWKQGVDGVYAKTVKKETKRLAFSLATGNASELKRTAELVADDWRALGAEVDLKFFDQNDLNNEILRPRKYEALLFGLVVGRDLDLFAFWHSSQRNDPGLNIALYANIAVDKKLEAARSELDPALRQKDVTEAAEQIAGEVAAVFLYAPHFVYVTPSGVMGIDVPSIVNPSDRFAQVDEWYLARERVWPVFITNNTEKASAIPFE